MAQTIGENILNLRKKSGITQEELASALHISSQAVSKWETNTCQPDTQTLPLIAAHFNVSIDYLFNGKDAVYDDIYEKVFQKTSSCPEMMSKESFWEALKIFAHAHHGISHGNLTGRKFIIYDSPAHISNENGLSLLSGKGYGAIITRDFFENITTATLDFAKPIFEAFSKPNVLSVISAIISMSDISMPELIEKTRINDCELRQALEDCVSCGLVIEETSKHKALGRTYKIVDMYHTCICILLATMEMQRYSLEGISCCMGYGDYPIKLNNENP